MNELTVLLPAYNEEECLEALVQNWQQYQEKIRTCFDLDLHIVIINDGSTDHTRAIGERLMSEFDNVTLVNHPQNMGLGAGVKTGLFYALDQRKNSIFCCLMDCDNTHDPKYVMDMLQKEKDTNADVIIASRYQQGAKVFGVSKIRLLTSEGAKAVYSMILQVKNVHDYTCGYRLYRRSILKTARARFGESLVSENGFTCMAELLYKLYACGAVFAEVPFVLRYDFKEGASKMHVLKTALRSVVLAFRLKSIKRLNKGES